MVVVMSDKFSGSYMDIKKAIRLAEIPGYWREIPYSFHRQFITKQGVILNWWKSTKTIYFQNIKSKADQIVANKLRNILLHQETVKYKYYSSSKTTT